MVDDPDAGAGADAAHLGSCPECADRFQTFADDARSIASLLAVPEARVDVGRAFERVMSDRKSQPALVLFPILGPSTRPLTLGFVATIAAVAVLLVAFAAAGLFFKPTTVKADPATVADIQALTPVSEHRPTPSTKEPRPPATSTAAASASAGR